MSGVLPEFDGPVTIMFTDIEGSTALRTSLGDVDTDALFARHDEIVRQEIEANRGHDQKAALGDGFLAAFVSTRRAIACAIAIQRALDAFNRARVGGPLRVRIGLNTGEVAQHDGQLSGEAVHAAARVCAAGEGGQILVSDVTRQLSGTIPDVTFRDTGEHQLKGFPQPWRLWDVVWVRETSAIPEQVFVGREHELSMLRAKLSSALDGRGGLVLVGGEPGVGKTTLVRQLIREAEQRGALAVFGRCYESEGTVPYSPFVEMLEQALGIMPPDIVREDMGEDAPEVARMVPELRRRFPDIPEPLDLPPEQQRRYFFNAVGAFVSRGAARFPLLLVLDDVHWADEPTLLLIEHMAQLMPEIRALAVGTYRDVELDVARPLAATLERLLRGRLVERISVKRFDRDGVATMLEALAGRTPPDQIVGAVFEETEGNPFFVEEVFRHLVEEGKVFDADGNFRADITVGELDVPESVRLVVGRRLERLGAQSQKVLAAGAVVGRAFPFSLLEVITELDAGTLLDVVEEAEAARVIVPEERDGEIHYSFAHELIRQTLLGSISLLRRQRLHLTVANAIESTDKRAREERPSEIANHLMQAGAAAETERTLEYLELAADRAMDAAAFEEAVRAVEDALSLVDADDKTTWAGLRERLGWALRALGRFEECLQIWDELVDVYRDLGNVEAATTLCREMSYQYLWLGRFDQVFNVNQRGLDILGDSKHVNRAYMIGGIGALLGLGALLDQGLERIDEAELTAHEFADERAVGWLNWTRCIVHYSNSQFSEAIEVGRRAMDQLRASGDLWSFCDAAAWTALALIVSGATADAHDIATEADELAGKLGHIGAQILLGRTLILEQGIRDADLAAYEQAVQVDFDRCKRINSPWIAQSYVWMASIAQLRGHVDEALGHLDEAIRLEPPSAFTGVGLGFKLLNRAYAEKRDELSALLDDAWPQLPEKIPAGVGPVVALMGAAQAVAILGLAEHAAKLYDRVRAATDYWVHTWFDGALTHRIAGMIASLLERWDEAEEHFRKALRQVDDVPNRLDAPRVQYWYARMLVDRGMPGDVPKARELLTQALEGYRRIGMPLHLRWTEERLKALS